MFIKEKKILHCTSYRTIRNYDSSVEQNFKTETSGRHIESCAEKCYGMTKGIHSYLDK